MPDLERLADSYFRTVINPDDPAFVRSYNAYQGQNPAATLSRRDFFKSSAMGQAQENPPAVYEMAAELLKARRAEGPALSTEQFALEYDLPDDWESQESPVFPNTTRYEGVGMPPTLVESYFSKVVKPNSPNMSPESYKKNISNGYTRDRGIVEDMATELYDQAYPDVPRERFDRESGLNTWRDEQPSALAEPLVGTANAALSLVEGLMGAQKAVMDVFTPSGVISEWERVQKKRADDQPLTPEEKRIRLPSEHLSQTMKAIRGWKEKIGKDQPHGATLEEWWDQPVNNLPAAAWSAFWRSLPDMMLLWKGKAPGLAAVTTAWTGRNIEERQKADKREGGAATVGDLAAGLSTAGLSVIAEKVGIEFLFGRPLVGRAIKEASEKLAKRPLSAAAQKTIDALEGSRSGRTLIAALGEGTTEGAQSVIEHVGTRAGTKTGVDPSRLGQETAYGVSIGATIGGAIRGGTETAGMTAEQIARMQSTQGEPTSQQLLPGPESGPVLEGEIVEPELPMPPKASPLSKNMATEASDPTTPRQEIPPGEMHAGQAVWMAPPPPADPLPGRLVQAEEGGVQFEAEAEPDQRWNIEGKVYNYVPELDDSPEQKRARPKLDELTYQMKRAESPDPEVALEAIVQAEKISKDQAVRGLLNHEERGELDDMIQAGKKRLEPAPEQPAATPQAPEQQPQAPRPTPETHTLLEAIADLGGLDRAQAAAEWGYDDETMKGLRSGTNPVFRAKGGRNLDEIAEVLAEAGYLPKDDAGKWDLADLERALGEALGRQGTGLPQTMDEELARENLIALANEAQLEGVDEEQLYAILNELDEGDITQDEAEQELMGAPRGDEERTQTLIEDAATITPKAKQAPKRAILKQFADKDLSYMEARGALDAIRKQPAPKTTTDSKANFDRQQELMRLLPNNIGKIEQAGKLTPVMRERMDELAGLQKILPQESEDWQAHYKASRAKTDQQIAEQRETKRADTERRLTEGGWKVGEAVVIPRVAGLLGAEMPPLKGTVKINKAGDAYVAAEGKRLDFWQREWERWEEPQATQPTAEPVTKEEVPPPAPKRGATNKVFTQDAYDEARAKLRAKLDQLNVGLDPELLSLGLQVAGYHIEAGARSFGAYSKAMVEDMGERVRPYLKSWYNGVRDMPEMETERTEMTPYVDVERLAEPKALDAILSGEAEQPAPEAETAPDLSEFDTPPAAEPGQNPPKLLMAAYLTELNRNAKNSSRGVLDAKRAVEIAQAVWQGQLGQDFPSGEMFNALEAAINVFLSTEAESLRPATLENVEQLKKFVESSIGNLSFRDQKKDAWQQFSTPPHLAYTAVAAAQITDKDVVLEPSAGNGGLAVMAKILAPGATLQVNELDPARRETLRALGLDPSAEDAGQLYNIMSPELDSGARPRPTVVIMNPPFSHDVTTNQKGNEVGARHIEQAMRMLAPGGRLVTIVGGGREGQDGGLRPALGSRALKAYWKRMGSMATLRADIPIQGKEYRRYGTDFPTRIQVYDKMPEGGVPIMTLQWPDSLEGDRTVEEAFVELEKIPARWPIAEQPSLLEQPAPAERKTDEEVLAADYASLSEADQTRYTAMLASIDTRHKAITSKAQTLIDNATGNKVVIGTEINLLLQRVTEAAPGQRMAALVQAEQRVAELEAVEAEAKKPDKTDTDKRTQVKHQIAPVSTGDRRNATLDKAQDQANTESEIRDQAELASNSTYQRYRQAAVFEGQREAGVELVESTALSTVSPPSLTTSLHVSQALIESGQAHGHQLEAAAYAAQAHERKITIMLPTSPGTEPDKPSTQVVRRGYLVGDGTGTGKTRVIGTILLDNWEQGRRKAIVISEKEGLIAQLQGDMKVMSDANGPFSDGTLFPVANIESIKKKKAQTMTTGIAFITYDSLWRETKKHGVWLDRIVEWFGEDFDGVLVFDEAHNLNNSTEQNREGRKSKPVKKAQAGMDLQRRLPNARVLYASATSAVEISDMRFAERLGLWGEGTQFTSASDFQAEIDSAGLAGFEVVARDMKSMGLSMSRHLTWRGVNFHALIHEMTAPQKEVYDNLAKGFQLVLRNIEEALQSTGQSEDAFAKSRAKSLFWSMNQRFWKQVLMSQQMASVLKAMDEAIAAGYSPVVQLTETGEAAQNRSLSKLVEEGQTDLGFLDMTPLAMLQQYIDKAFPTVQMKEVQTSEGKSLEVVRDSKGNPVHNPNAIASKQKMLKDLEQWKVPDGPIEQLLKYYGTDKVAELTGRSMRVVPDATGQMVQEKRNKNTLDAELDDYLNGDGTRDILLFSTGKAGTGYNFNASPKFMNQKPRMLFAFPSWSLTKTIQGFGRIRRVDDLANPTYQIVSTDMPGMKRFMSTLARRLEQYGSLVHGQRDASAGGAVSSADNLETQQGAEAVRDFVFAIAKRGDLGKELLVDKMGMTDLFDGVTISDDKMPNITNFLNRLLNLTFEEQQDAFGVFESKFQDRTAKADAAGLIDKGMERIEANKVIKLQEEEIPHDGMGTTTYVKLEMSDLWEKLSIEELQKQGEDFVQNKKSKNVSIIEYGKREQTYKGELQIVHTTTTITNNMYRWTDAEFREKFEVIDKKTATPALQQQIKYIEDNPYKRPDIVHMVTGTLLPVWKKIPPGFAKVYRTKLTEGEGAGQGVLGRVIPPVAVGRFLESMGIESSITLPTMPALAADLLRHATNQVNFGNGWLIRWRSFGGQERLVLSPNPADNWNNEPPTDMDFLRNAGVAFEKQYYSLSGLMPSNTAEIVQVLTAIVSRTHITALDEAKVAEKKTLRAEDLAAPGRKKTLEHRFNTGWQYAPSRGMLRNLASESRQRGQPLERGYFAEARANLVKALRPLLPQRRADRTPVVFDRAVAELAQTRGIPKTTVQANRTRDVLADLLAHEGRRLRNAHETEAFLHALARQIAPGVDMIVREQLVSQRDGTTPVRGLLTFDVDGPTIQVSLNSPDPVGTFSHETIHALRNMGLFTEQEWTALVKNAASGDWLTPIRSAYPDLFTNGRPTDAAFEEAIAEGFADWLTGNLDRYTNPVRQVFAKMADFFRRLVVWLTGQPAGTYSYSPATRKVFQAILRGDVGQRTSQQQAGGQPREARFDDQDDGWTQYQAGYDAAHGITTDRTFVGRVLEDVRAEAAKLTQYYPGIENRTENAELLERLRHMREAYNAAVYFYEHEWVRPLWDPLTDAERRTFTQVLDLEDAAWQAEQQIAPRGRDDVQPMSLPEHYGTAERIAANRLRLEDDLTPAVRESLARRRRAMQAINEAMKDAGIDLAFRDDFYHHQILDYARVLKSGVGANRRTEPARWYTRYGTDKAHNTDYVQAEADWVIKAYVDVQMLNFVNWLRQSPHNKKPEFVRQAHEANSGQLLMLLQAEAMKDLRPNKEGGDYLRALTHPSEVRSLYQSQGLEYPPFLRQWNALAQQIAEGFGMIAERVPFLPIDERRQLPERLVGLVDRLSDPERNHGVGDDTSTQAGEASMLDLVYHLASTTKHAPLRQAATFILKSTAARRAWLASVLGDGYVNPRDTKALMARFGEEGQESWTPNGKRGSVRASHVFTAWTLPEQIMDRAMDELRDVMPATMDSRFRVALDAVVDQLHKQRVIGGIRNEMIVESGVAEALDNYRDPTMERGFASLFRIATSTTKIAHLFSPWRFPRFLLNNMITDFDVIIGVPRRAGAPAFVRWQDMRAAARAVGWRQEWPETEDMGRLGQAIQMLSEIGDKDTLPEVLREAVQYGVIHSGQIRGDIFGEMTEDQTAIDLARKVLSGREVWTLEKASALKRLPKKYLDFVTGVALWRENVFRLAAYMHYRNELVDAKTGDATGRSMQEVGYGAASQKIVKGLEGQPKFQAALLARSMFGDYGDVGYRGRQLARYGVLLYHRFQSTNFNRYANLLVNIPDMTPEVSQAGADGAHGTAFSIKMFMNVALLTTGIGLWNALVAGDEDEELGEQFHHRMHMTLPRWLSHSLVPWLNPETILTLPIGAGFTDFLGWTGIEDPAILAKFAMTKASDVMAGAGMEAAAALLAETIKGRVDVDDVLNQVAIDAKLLHIPKGPVEKLMFGTHPAIKLPFELLSGKSFFPDVARPREIPDRWQHFWRSFALDPLYNDLQRLRGSPVPGPGLAGRLGTMIFYPHNPGQAGYYESRALAREYADDSLQTRRGGDAEKTSALRRALRRAIQRGEHTEAATLAATLMGSQVGIHPRDMQGWFRSNSPIANVRRRDRGDFLSKLTIREREQVDRDMRRWEDAVDQIWQSQAVKQLRKKR